jgi:hypothetical protein
MIYEAVWERPRRFGPRGDSELLEFLKEKSARNSVELVIHLIGTTNAINYAPFKFLDNVRDG